MNFDHQISVAHKLDHKGKSLFSKILICVPFIFVCKMAVVNLFQEYTLASLLQGNMHIFYISTLILVIEAYVQHT